ncbi:hypothetical protein NASALF_100 [Candidatus Nasuia deltocephalinicola str. NAS-ALF]|uniref:Uncharacterized protein n=1 Tax=Candidatus Nasuia deltocephalinicola str. NAS-ALF TaxID=1343077 RepID=S5TEY6_9PROT|nr:hypothetical protein NASALF_100 [Candidatus Nasuia deltocephalinicola str. NAS-ALF]
MFFKINIKINNSYLFIKKHILNIIKNSLFKNLFLNIKSLNLFQMHIFNKKKKFFKIFKDLLTFNFFLKSFIFFNLKLIYKKSKKKNINNFLFFFLNLLHSLLHSQNLRDDNFKKFKIMNAFQNKILLNLGFFIK